MRIAVTTTAAKLMPQFEASQGQSAWSADRSTPSAPATAIPCCPWPGGITPGRPISPSTPGHQRRPGCHGGFDRRGDHRRHDHRLHRAAGHRHRRAHMAGIRRAHAKGIQPGRCFAVVMIGRLDDYLERWPMTPGPRRLESDIPPLRLWPWSNAPIESTRARIFSRAAHRGIARSLSPDRVGRADLLMSIRAVRFRKVWLPTTCRTRSASISRYPRVSNGSAGCRNSCAPTNRT